MWKFLEGSWGGEWGDVPMVSLDKIGSLLGWFALFVTVALAVVLIVYAIAIRNYEEERLVRARRLIVGVVVGYSVGVISILGLLRLLYYHYDGKINSNFWLMMGLFALLIAGLSRRLRCTNARSRAPSGADWHLRWHLSCTLL